MNTVLIYVVLSLFILAALLLAAFALGKKGKHFKMDLAGAAPRAQGGSDTSAGSDFKKRLHGLSAFVAAIVSVLTFKLFSMEIVDSDDYVELAESNRTRKISTEAPRGRILDRNGRELVSNRPSLTVMAHPDVADNTLECQLLANLIGMPRTAVRRKIQDSSKGAQSMRVVAVDISRSIVAFLEERSYLFQGIEIKQQSQRLYPQGNLAAHVLGYISAVTPEQLDDKKDKDEQKLISYQSGDLVGQSGVELQYESVLQGVRGEQTVFVNADGKVVDYVDSIQAQAGSDVVLTLDSTIQKAAEDALVSTINKIKQGTNPHCNAGSVVCIDATNGDILALASAPTYAPGLFVGGISASDWSALSSDKSGYPLLNRAVSGQYPSASTIKPLSVFAALNYGIAGFDTTYNCTGFWTGFGKNYGQYCWEHSGHGIINMEKGVVFSCDVVFYEIGKAFFYSNEPEGLQKTYRKWGLGSKTNVDLPSESAGRVPDAQWKKDFFKDSSKVSQKWQGGDNTNLAIGQGDLLVTPLQMACAYAAIANGGSCFEPHILKSVRSSDTKKTVLEHKKKNLLQIEEKNENIDMVHRALSGVIYEESPSQASHFTNMKEPVAGKTGTAQIAGHDADTGWFVAYVPSDNPKYVIASCIEDGGFGTQSALQVVRDVMGAIYNEPDTSNVQVAGDR